MMEAAHARSGSDVAEALEADPVDGLTEAEAARRLAAVGANVVGGDGGPRYLGIAARQFTDPLVLLLVVAAIVSLAIGEAIEAAVIATIVVANAVLGFVQESGAERALDALRAAAEATASVVRGGQEVRVAAAAVVPGDLLVLREGDRVAADARLVEAIGLAVDESALTGESVPVDKDVAATAADAPLAERTSLVFAGTGVTRGGARAIVVATGAATEVGGVAALTARAAHPRTPLQRRLARVSRLMVLVGAVVTTALTGAMLARGADLDEAFLVGVAVAVAAVPEGLAATVTIALAQGARDMAARGAIVRRLAAVETLGAASVIATDKTGTLTQNVLRVVAVAPLAGHDEADVLRLAGLSSMAGVDATGTLVGDPIDVALLRAALDGGADPRSASRSERVVTPFDAVRRSSTVAYRSGGRWHAVVKGAPEALLDRADRTGPGPSAVLASADALAAQGLRVLALAQRQTDDPRGDDPDGGLEIAGLVGLADPLRPAASGAVAAARAAGVRVVMVTGDHATTADAIARQLGLEGGPARTGASLDGLRPEELAALAGRHAAFARVAPADKLRLVEGLQHAGGVVAVTGDGVNDAPALRQADVGVAMGRGGTEAAREAADIVLTDDDFATIVAAIREGRRIRDNITRFVAFLLSANLGEVVVFAVAITAGLGAPLTVVQILLVNLLTDGLPAIALARDPAGVDTMTRPPGPADRLLTRDLLAALAGIAAVVGLVTTAAFLIGRADDAETGRTMAFAVLALAELGLVFTVRSATAPAWRAPRNRALVGAVAVSAVVVLVAVQVRTAADLLGCAPLGAWAWAIVAGLALLPALTVEAVKGARRRAAAP